MHEFDPCAAHLVAQIKIALRLIGEWIGRHRWVANSIFVIKHKGYLLKVCCANDLRDSIGYCIEAIAVCGKAKLGPSLTSQAPVSYHNAVAVISSSTTVVGTEGMSFIERHASRYSAIGYI